MKNQSFANKNIFSNQILNILSGFYFATMVFIMGTIIYALVSQDFNSVLSFYVLTSIPPILIFSLIIYNPIEIVQYLKCFPAYIYYLPTHINILQIYSICNIDNFY